MEVDDTAKMIEASEATNNKRVEQGPELPHTLLPLERLAWNFWWSWSAEGPSIFRSLDPDLWEEVEHNPRLLLARTSESWVAQMATDPAYISRVRRAADSFDDYMKPSKLWQDESGSSPITPERPVAYFCAEYGVHNSLPLYSGGLGMLAGDHLKSASDLKLPLLGIGLLYRYGYFRQSLRRDGWQEEYYGETHPSELPIHLIKDEKGARLLIEVLIRDRVVRAQVWRAEVGRVPLYLLDTNITENEETDRWVTAHLYGGDRETRIVQEMLLGIGGVRLLRKLGIEPHVYHLNEGHSAFLTLELARELIHSRGLSFAEASKLVREQCIFTTHTPVAAGNDEFDPDLIRRSFGPALEQELGLTHDEFLALGRIDPTNHEERFGLTPLAIRMCRSTNGVSRKHGEVSRALWHKLFPQLRVEEVPITHVTNGVHAPTWVAPLIRSLYEASMGEDWTNKVRDPRRWEKGIARISDEELWNSHRLLKRGLVAFIRHRSFHARLARNESVEYAEAARIIFDPEALTIGFARRIAGYKRWGLLLTDQERLLKMINNSERPVQLVFAGKAHPQDQGAKFILQQIAQWKHDPNLGGRAVFLQDYDQEIARQLVSAVDVWLNVPRKPLEASGTSGEKVAINCGLNLSVLDGWWLEGYDGKNGFAIGDSSAPQNDAEVDASDAESLYCLLEDQVIPLYYDRDRDGLPRKWISMMKRSIATLVPAYNSDRMVEEYARRLYRNPDNDSH
ncbi:MAG TPA: alpha-glucan family phosphorylase [Pyrinomonadaceae bacterium]|nr:alpha-glucan family phosphorylase [Pyrinomonadaceae bacterium]